MTDDKISGVAATIAAPAATTTAEGASTPDPPEGRSLIAGRYQILNLLGDGGMGRVYRARDIELNELVALKVLHPELVNSPTILERFRQEVKLARRVTHRNVARTYDIGEHEGSKFITMELIDGELLSSIVARRGALSLSRLVHVAVSMCHGMSAAHAAGIIHRDLKPENVMVARDGRVVIMDFGIARAHVERGAPTVTGEINLGTPAYMSPEQVDGKTRVDSRTDIYALGLVLYEMATGVLAWPGDHSLQVATARLLQDPPDVRALRPDLPDALADVIQRCMARNPADRPASADEIAHVLEPFGDEGSFPGAASGNFRVRDAARSQPGRTPAIPLVVRESSQTLAVLPFRNAGPPEDEFLADGITEEIIDTLSMTRGLRLRSLGAVAGYKGRTSDPGEIGRELAVRVIVEGSVRRVGETVRINARLVSVDDRFQLWAQRFDRPTSDLLVVSDEVASAIAKALTITPALPARGGPSDPIAIELYLRARQLQRRFWREPVTQAVALYEQALERVPDDPAILSACATARVRLWFLGGEGAAENGERARAAAERAVAVAPHRGEPWNALATVRLASGDPIGAASDLRTAIAQAPGLAEAHDTLGRMLVEVGRVDEGIVRLQMAVTLDPSLATAKMELARARALAGDFASAYRLAGELRPVDAQTGALLERSRICLWHRDREQAVKWLDPIANVAGPLELARALLQLIVDGELHDELRQLLKSLVGAADGGTRRLSFFLKVYAEVLAYVFDVDGAVRAIETAAKAGLFDLSWTDGCPLLEPVRHDPRFASLRAQIADRAAKVSAALGATGEHEQRR
jgi:serine/threonine protein kinase/tetratricopeptide (TPR) repeat protein